MYDYLRLIRCKESPPIPLATPDNLEPILLLCSMLINIRNKKMKFRTQPVSPLLLNEAGNLPPFHFTILPPFQPCHLTTLALFPPFQVLTTSPSPLPLHLSDLAPRQLLTIPSSHHHSQLATSLPSLLSHLANSALHTPVHHHLFQLATALPSNLSNLAA